MPPEVDDPYIGRAVVDVLHQGKTGRMHGMIVNGLGNGLGAGMGKEKDGKPPPCGNGLKPAPCGKGSKPSSYGAP